jgi:chemosensory pili system protein ChpE/L-lysine exporter family protein LysE/ArgO
MGSSASLTDWLDETRAWAQYSVFTISASLTENFNMSILIAAFFLGLVFNAAPGAIFAETVRRGATGGFRPAFAVQIGSLVGDATWAVMGLLGVGVLLQVDALKWPVGLAGAAYLLWLAWDSWKAASVAFTIRHNEAEQTQSALRSGVVLSLTNPQNIAYWAALGSALGALGVSNPSLTDYALFFAGFMISSVLWAVFCAAAIHKIFQKAGHQWIVLTYRLCAVMFLVLALNTVRGLFSHTEAPEPKTSTVVACSATRYNFV